MAKAIFLEIQLYTHLFQISDSPIDPSEYRIACASYNLPDTDVSTEHTVGRFGWSVGEPENPTSYTSDDIVTASTKLNEVCYDLYNLPIEVGSQTVNGNFWTAPVNSVEFHPNEILTNGTTSIVTDFRLATFHKVSNKFAVVVGGDTDKKVELYYTTSNAKTGGTKFCELPANRNTNVCLLDSAGLTNGTAYYIYSVIGSNSYMAPRQSPKR